MPKLFDELRERLLRAGVAPRHIQRYIAELDDHLDELRQQGNTSAEALGRLGTAEDLAKSMLDRREFRSWVARAPWAAMVLGPIVTMIATGIAIGASVLGLVLLYRWIAPWSGRVESMPLQNFVHAATAFVVLILPLMIGWAAAAIAIRQRLRPLWPLIGLALFAFISGTFGLEIAFPNTPGSLHELTFGFSQLNPASSLFDPTNVSPARWIANFVLLVGPYLAWRYRENAVLRDGHDVARVERVS